MGDTFHEPNSMHLYRPILVVGTIALALGCSDSSGPAPLPGTHPTGQTLTALPLSGRPHGVAIAPNGVFYVSQIDANTITRGTLTETTESFSGQASVGATPAHVAIDAQASTAYTTNQSGRTVSIVDVATNALAGTVPLSNEGFNLLVSPDGRRVWATTAGAMLHVIDAATRQSTATVPVGSAANGLAYDARSNILYVSSLGLATITAINATTNAVVRTYPVGALPQRLALSPDGTELYVASEEHGLEILSVATGTVTIVSVVPAGSVGLALSPDGVQLYVTNPPAGQVHVVDRVTRELVRTYPNMGRPRNVAFDHEGTTAVITDETNFVRFIR
jgi:YVTN family beta-propeller protein